MPGALSYLVDQPSEGAVDEEYLSARGMKPKPGGGLESAVPQGSSGGLAWEQPEIDAADQIDTGAPQMGAQPAPGSFRVSTQAPGVDLGEYGRLRREIRSDDTETVVNEAYKKQLEAQTEIANATTDLRAAQYNATQWAKKQRDEEMAALNREREIAKQAEAEAAKFASDTALEARYGSAYTADEVRLLQRAAQNTALSPQERAGFKAKLDAAKTIDPGRILGSTGNKILAGLASILGGIGAGLTGGPNVGLAAVQDAIDRDVDAQRERYARGKEAALAANDAYAKLRAKGLTDYEAGQSLIATRYQQSLEQADDMLLKFEAEVALPQAQSAMAEMRAKQAQALSNLRDSRRSQLLNVANSEQNAAMNKFEMERKSLAATVAASNDPLNIPGVGRVRDKSLLKDVVDTKSEADTILAQIDKLEQMLGAKGFDYTKAGEAEALVKDLTVRMGRMYNLGALSEGDLNLVEGMVGKNPNDWIQFRNQGRLKTTADAVKTSADQYLGRAVVNYSPSWGGGGSQGPTPGARKRQ